MCRRGHSRGHAEPGALALLAGPALPLTLQLLPWFLPPQPELSETAHSLWAGTEPLTLLFLSLAVRGIPKPAPQWQPLSPQS